MEFDTQLDPAADAEATGPITPTYYNPALARPPTGAELVAEFNRPALILSPRPKHDIRSVKLALAGYIVEMKAAQATLDRATASLGNAAASIAAAEEASAAFAGLDDEVAETFAQQIIAGQPPALTDSQEAIRAEQVRAEWHIKALRSAHQKLAGDVQTLRANVATAEHRVNRAVIQAVECMGVELAEKLEATRADFLSQRAELLALADIRLGNARPTITPLWREMLDAPIPEVSHDAGKVMEWNKMTTFFARNGLPDAADQPGDDADETDAAG